MGEERTTSDGLFGSQSCEVSDATWRKYGDGDKVAAKVRASSGNLVCSSL